jgi:DNA-binding transcriptional ArsR family regulator
LPHPADITDPTIAKAYAHPLRIEIMGLLDNRVASPRQLATELGASLPTTSYHVRQLVSMGLIKLVRRRQTRGSIEHFYTASIRPRMYDEVWSRLPSITKRAIIGGRLSQLGKEIFSAAEAGGFDREDIHLTRTRMTLTRAGWEEVSAQLAEALSRFDEIKARDAARVEGDPDAPAIEATAVMALFETPLAAMIEGGGAALRSEPDEFADIAPPS